MANIIPREFIQLVLAKIDLVDLITNAQIPLRKKSGSNYFARCPFHQEKSGSFSVSQPKQFYHCFGCGAHGNAIDFLMQHDRLSFPEAVETLARQVALEVPRQITASSSDKDHSITALFDLTAQVTKHYYNQMRRSDRAIHYLKNREISGAIAKQFSLGYAENGWHHLLDLFGKDDLSKKKLLDTGLIIKKNEGGYYDRFRDRIMFPIHDYRGRIIGFGGRVLDQGEPKYLNSPETPLFQKGHELYGLYQALKANRKLERVLVVEGYMDVIALFQHGITYAVATLGTATTAHHLQRLFRYTTEIIFCFDGDDAGRTAAWRALQVLLPLMNDTLQIRFLFLPEGEDPDTLIRKVGPSSFEQHIQSAQPLSAFFFHTLSQQIDITSLEGRARFAAQAMHHIQHIPQGIFQNIIIEELAKRARVDIPSLKQQINIFAKPKIDTAAPPSKKPEEKFIIAAPVRLTIALLLQNPALAEKIHPPIPDTTLPGVLFLKQLIEIIQNRHNIITTGSLIEHWRGQKEETFVAKLAQWEHMIPLNELENAFLSSLRQLTVLSFNEEIDRLLAKAAQSGLSEEERLELSNWIAKKKAIII